MRILSIDDSPVLKMGLFYESESKAILDWVVENAFKHHILNQVYAGKITKVVDALDAAFVDIGLSQNGFIRKKEILKHLGLEDEAVQKNPISHFIKPGDLIFAKVSKEAFQSKGMQLSSDIAIKGNHVVFLPYSKGVKFSRKIGAAFEKETLLNETEAFVAKGYGFIVRTTARAASEVLSELTELVEEWEKKTHYARLGRSVGCLYETNGFWQQIKEGLYKFKPDRCLVTTSEQKDQLASLGFNPKAIELRKNAEVLYRENNLPMDKWIDQNVYEHPLGLSVTVDELEAFVVIDINSGKWVSSDAMALNVNQKAAAFIEEIITLKGLSGVLLIDFIDLGSEDRKKLLQHLEKNVFKADEGYSLYGFTKLGLFEILKKRERPSLMDLLSLDYHKRDLIFWHLNELFFELKRLAVHTNTTHVVLEVETDLYQFLAQNNVLASLPLTIKIKHLKNANKIYKLNTVDKSSPL